MRISVESKCEECNGYGFLQYESQTCGVCRGSGKVSKDLVSEYLVQGKVQNFILRLHGLIGDLQDCDRVLDRDLVIKKIQNFFPEIDNG